MNMEGQSGRDKAIQWVAFTLVGLLAAILVLTVLWRQSTAYNPDGLTRNDQLLIMYVSELRMVSLAYRIETGDYPEDIVAARKLLEDYSHISPLTYSIDYRLSMDPASGEKKLVIVGRHPNTARVVRASDEGLFIGSTRISPNHSGAEE